MPKIHLDSQANSDITSRGGEPFVYRRPRCAVRHLLRQLTIRGVARITAQVLTSASLIAAGILVCGPAGALLAITGFCLTFSQEDEQTPTQYREAVIAHFEARGQTPPRWTRRTK